MSSKPIALLVMHYGTPASLEEVPAYYTHIRHGRPPAPEDLEDLVSRYKAIGGPSPLKAISEQQAALICEGVKAKGVDAKLYIGAKHTHPFIAEAVKQIAEDGIDRVLALVLAPHYSSFSVVAYRKYALQTRDEVAPNMQIDFVERWGELPALIDALASRVKAQLSGPTGREPLSKGEALVAGSEPTVGREALANGPDLDKLQPVGPTGRESLAKGEVLVTGGEPTLGREAVANGADLDRLQPVGPTGRESLAKGEALVGEPALGREALANGADLDKLQPEGPTGRESLAKGEALVGEPALGREALANGADLDKLQPVGPTGRESLAKGEALVTRAEPTKGAEDFWSRFEEPAEKSSAPAATTEAWDPEETLVIFSAHSLPKRIMAEGDPYVEELLATSKLVAEAANVPNWKFAFQSASKTGEPWLGPDILDVIDEERSNYKNFLACTVGFVSDHLEVLYDLGIETRDHCQKLGVNYRRAETIGADETVMNALSEVCVETLARFTHAVT